MKNFFEILIFVFIFFIGTGCSMKNSTGPDENVPAGKPVPPDTFAVDFEPFTLKAQSQPEKNRTIFFEGSCDLWVVTQVDTFRAKRNNHERWLAELYQCDSTGTVGKMITRTDIFEDPGEMTPQPMNGEAEVILPPSYLGQFTGPVVIKFIHQGGQEGDEDSIKFLSLFAARK